MKKFLRWINIPLHIKNYFLRRKIQKYKGSDTNQDNKQNKKSKLLKVINFLILVAVFGELTYLNLNYENQDLFLATVALVAVVVIYFVVKTFKKLKKDAKKYKTIKKLVLKNQEGKIIKDWDVKDKTALLVGKNAENNNVDIDLSATTYSSLISREHAVLNNVENKWYFEDLDSLNGSGIRRKHNNQKFKANAGQPYKLNPGDTIYIANTKLIVK